MIRLCDGNTSHGFGTSMRTLMKLNEINGSVEVYAQNNSYLWDKTNNYLKVKVKGNEENIGKMLKIVITKADFPICEGKIL